MRPTKPVDFTFPTPDAPAPPVRRRAPVGETKRQRFLRIGQPRMGIAIKYLRLLGNLAHPSYGWEVRDIEHMRAILHREVDAMIARFDRKSRVRGEALGAFEQAHGHSNGADI